jgi:hypothetical protein
MTDVNEIDVAEPVAPARSGLLAKCARPAEALLGAVFLVSALLKAADANAFIVAIGLYGVVVGPQLQAMAAVCTLALETAVGTALLLGVHPRKLTLGLAAAMLFGFSGLIVYGWAFHGISDCGCMGPIKLGPLASLAKNAALLALCIVAALGFRGRASTGRGNPLKALVVVILAACVAGYAFAHIQPAPAPTTPESRPYAQFVFQENGRSFDLGKGEYLVALLNMECEHCRASVEKLNKLVEIPNLPPLIGLCDGNPESLKEFKLVTAAQFPLHLIEMRVFYTLIKQQPPCFVYVRDGKVVKLWEEEVPTPKAISEARQQTSPDRA